jgi:hypothetical protein
VRKKHGKSDREIARVLAYYRAVARRSNVRRERLLGTPARRRQRGCTTILSFIFPELRKMGTRD